MKATDLEGQESALGTKTVTCDNANAVKPFGTLDSPAAGGTVSGSDYSILGWALTPQPSSIPEDGSTITVWMDGIPLGHPIYDQFRPDIAGLFPGYANSGGAGFFFSLDTTAYANGMHTVNATVTDSGGNSEGLGSRFFRIDNPGADVPVELLAFGIE